MVIFPQGISPGLALYLYGLQASPGTKGMPKNFLRPVKLLEKQQILFEGELKELQCINDSLHRQLMELHVGGNNSTYLYSLKEDLDKMYEIKMEQNVDVMN